MKIAVLCPTCRPHLLGYMVCCFERQTHPDRVLIILDDSGTLPPAQGDRWELVSTRERYPTLGAKRNALVALVPPDVDALVAWDDDDLYLPWGLEATAEALRSAPWSRPSQACHLRGGRLLRVRTADRPDGADRAYQCGWGILVDAFRQVGGYPDNLSVGEDRALASRLVALGVAQSDPMEMGHPWYVWGPHRNRHLAADGALYGQLALAPGGSLTVADPPCLDLDRPDWIPGVHRRPWRGDWGEYPAG